MRTGFLVPRPPAPLVTPYTCPYACTRSGGHPGCVPYGGGVRHRRVRRGEQKQQQQQQQRRGGGRGLCVHRKRRAGAPTMRGVCGRAEGFCKYRRIWVRGVSMCGVWSQPTSLRQHTLAVVWHKASILASCSQPALLSQSPLPFLTPCTLPQRLVLTSSPFSPPSHCSTPLPPLRFTCRSSAAYWSSATCPWRACGWS